MRTHLSRSAFQLQCSAEFFAEEKLIASRGVVDHRLVDNVPAAVTKRGGTGCIGDSTNEDNGDFRLREQALQSLLQCGQCALHLPHFSGCAFTVGHWLVAGIDQEVSGLLEAAEKGLLVVPHLLYREAWVEFLSGETNLRGEEDFHHFEEKRVSFCQPGEVEKAMDTNGGWCLRDEKQANGIWQVAIAGLGKALARIHLARVSQLRGACSHASMSTRFPRNRTPSIVSRKRCSAAASPRNLISPPAPTIRCQGR